MIDDGAVVMATEPDSSVLVALVAASAGMSDSCRRLCPGAPKWLAQVFAGSRLFLEGRVQVG